MKDVQEEKDLRNIMINQVGVSNVILPIIINQITTNGKFNLFVELDSNKKAIHMSRLIEVLNTHSAEINMTEIENILYDSKVCLNSKKALLTVEFSYFRNKVAPISKKTALMNYGCKIIAEMNEYDTMTVMCILNVPITSVCPCSKAISNYGAHNQRGIIEVEFKLEELDLIDKIIGTLESSGSQELYTLLKRVDEKFVTEKAYENAKFVEDIIRDVVNGLEKSKIIWKYITVENYESIHNHNAISKITNSNF